jgi:hypothetical protein
VEWGFLVEVEEYVLDIILIFGVNLAEWMCNNSYASVWNIPVGMGWAWLVRVVFIY